MKVLLKQKSKELYTAEFDLIQNEKVMGNVYVKGRMTSMEATVTIRFQNREFVMEHCKKRERNQYRFYKITSNNEEYGTIFQRKYKTGFMSCEYRPILVSNCSEYEINGNGIGRIDLQGLVKNEKGYTLTIQNDMYNFDIECSDNIDELYRTLIHAIYRYIIAYFNPGEKVSKFISKRYYREIK